MNRHHDLERRSQNTLDYHQGCCNGWVWVQQGRPGVVRPCEHCRPDLHDQWRIGAFEPQLWREIA